MFETTSRYYPLETATWVAPDGREIRYVRRRFLPLGDEMPLLAEVTVKEGDRLDLITARTLGDSEQFWRLCDDNDAMHPKELTAEIGRKLEARIPQA